MASLPILQTDLPKEQERYHRMLIATMTNELIKVRPPYDRTEAEIDEDVTPLNFTYPPGHLLRYGGDWAKAFSVASTGNVKVQVPGGSYSIASQIAHTGDVNIECLGPVTITCTNTGATINSLFKVTGKLRIYGASMTIDGDDKTYLLIHCPTTFPEIDNVTFKNCLSVAVLPGRNFGGANVNDYSGTNGVGHGWLRNCAFENVGSITIPAGSGSSSNTSFGLINCRSDANCGNVTNLFNMASMGYGYVHGGHYKGVSSTDPNMSRCERCEYIGGRYEGMQRGPTIGEESNYVTIVGGVSAGMAFSGVSLDARITSDNSVPYVTGKVDWTVEGTPSWGVFCQASGVEIHLRHIGDGTATSANASVRLTDALDVSIGTVTAYDAGGGLLVQLGEGAAPSPGSSAYKTGIWQSDTTSVSAVRASANSILHLRPSRTITASTDLSFLDDVVYVDAAAGIVDLDVPGTGIASNVFGHEWTVIVIDSTNNITITRDGGGATAINGGSSFTIPAGCKYTNLKIVSIGGGNYLVTVPSHFVSNSGTPVGVLTPTYVGQLARNTSATPDDFYIAVGLTNADWEQITP